VSGALAFIVTAKPAQVHGGQRAMESRGALEEAKGNNAAPERQGRAWRSRDRWGTTAGFDNALPGLIRRRNAGGGHISQR